MTSNRNRSGRRVRGLVPGAAVAGGLAVTAILMFSSLATAGIAVPTAFPGAYWSPNTWRQNDGCAQAHAFPAHWTALTGAGKSHGSTSAKTCPAYRGGTSVVSDGEVSQALWVWAPVSLPTGAGGVNVSWNFHVNGFQTSAMNGSNYACPTTTYSGSYNYGYTWYNYSEVYGFCSVYSDVNLWGYTYLYDVTSGAYFYPANYWSGIDNRSYIQNYTFSYTSNYSNSSYWSYNFSYSAGFNGTGGGPGSISGSYTPQWFINGTFSATDSYLVFSDMGSFQSSQVEGFSGSGHASTSINMATGANHEDLLPFSIW